MYPSSLPSLIVNKCPPPPPPPPHPHHPHHHHSLSPSPFLCPTLHFIIFIITAGHISYEEPGLGTRATRHSHSQLAARFDTEGAAAVLRAATIDSSSSFEFSVNSPAQTFRSHSTATRPGRGGAWVAYGLWIMAWVHAMDKLRIMDHNECCWCAGACAGFSIRVCMACLHRTAI